MRFQILLSFAMAAMAIAAPIAQSPSAPVFLERADAPDGLLQGVGKLLAGIEKAVGVTALEDALDETFHGEISGVEDALGSNRLEESINAYSGNSPKGVLQAVGSLLKTLEDKLGVTYLENALNKALGGKLVELEDKLGLTKLEDEGLDMGKRKVPDGVIQKVGNLIASLEEKLGVTALESALDKALDGKVTDLEDALGTNRAEKGAGLLCQGQTKKGLLQAVGRLVKGLEDDLGVTAVENALDATLGGKITDLEDGLGLTKLEKYLDLE